MNYQTKFGGVVRRLRKNYAVPPEVLAAMSGLDEDALRAMEKNSGRFRPVQYMMVAIKLSMIISSRGADNADISELAIWAVKTIQQCGKPKEED